jgi:GT2 family glycosyltransferase
VIIANPRRPASLALLLLTLPFNPAHNKLIMPKVTLIQVVYNHRKFIEKVYPAALNQTFKDFEFIAIISGNDDKGKELIQEKFPEVKVIDPGYNIGFAKGHNEYFDKIDSEFFQLVNPDLILTPTYVEEMLKAFEDPKVGAAEGKLLRYDFEQDRPLNVLDVTGVSVSKSGRGKARGQHEVDQGQYDSNTNVISVDGAAPMYRKAALEDVKFLREDGRYEYFDEDFHSYWEDVDLGLRMTNAGWKNAYVPKALAYHGRGVGSTPGGYIKVWSYVKFHKKISPWVRELNYRNHIFLVIKNFPRFYPQFFIRETAMFGYLVLFELSTLKSLPKLWRLLPVMFKKRKQIQKSRKISVQEFESLLN